MITDKMVEAAMLKLDQRAEGGRCGEMVREMLEAADHEAWQEMETAPTDGSIVLVYAPPPDPEKWHETVCGLPAIICTAAYHEDAGYCVDDIREPTHWRPLPHPAEGGLRMPYIEAEPTSTEYRIQIADRDATIARLSAEVERLRLALKPFGKVLRGNYSKQDDDMPIHAGFGPRDSRLVLRLRDFRAARAALGAAP